MSDIIVHFSNEFELDEATYAKGIVEPHTNDIHFYPQIAKDPKTILTFENTEQRDHFVDNNSFNYDFKKHDDHKQLKFNSSQFHQFIAEKTKHENKEFSDIYSKVVDHQAKGKMEFVGHNTLDSVTVHEHDHHARKKLEQYIKDHNVEIVLKH